MNILGERLPKIKQEVIPIVCLSIIQIWWSLTCPVFVRLGVFWWLLAAINSIAVGIFSIVWAFSKPDRFVSLFDNVKSILLIISVNMGTITAWYYDYLKVSNIYYVMQIVFVCLAFALLYRAANRNLLFHC